ncbi:AAEL014335-PA [Aedes aegypti]|uniref:AAEL014335-PA n=1 Tax=Aedes aegypti TaxID=7159 RepID=Q16GL9_AEDAE|nr:AAEL014335-PA [Aedes aegypti]
MINLLAIHRRRRRKGELISPEVQSNSSNEISCSSSTSGVVSDCGTSQDENIYQQIWTCKTEGTEPVYESPQENIYESIRIVPAQDEHEWEVVDDFAFSKSARRTLSQQPPPVPNRNIRHPLDRYKNVCILYNPIEPKTNRIFYNYRRDYIFDYRKTSDDSDDSSASSCIDDDEELDFSESCADSEDYGDGGVVEEEPNNSGKRISQSREIPEKHSCYSIPDCVQYWKFMLLNVNYNDDEEDMIMTEKTLAVISQNIDKTVFPTVPQQSSPTTIQKPPQPLSPGVPHSPTFSGPAANKPQIPVSDSCVGTYTSKSAENLPDVVAPQEKEKSPNPKRERMRDKLMNALPSMNSSRHPNDGLVFGVELSLVEQDDKFKVPRFVVECVEILKEQENIETSGLYRASGNKNSIENIKKKLNEKRSPKKYEFLKKQDVHSLTGSLKLFFRELKSPLIAKDVYESCVQQTKDEVKTIEQIKLSIAKMDLINRNTLHYLIRHLKCVHQHSDVNMMNSSNLAIVWGACLFASTLGLMESYENNDLGKINTLVKQLIDHYDKIFYDDKSD